MSEPANYRDEPTVIRIARHSSVHDTQPSVEAYLTSSYLGEPPVSTVYHRNLSDPDVLQITWRTYPLTERTLTTLDALSDDRVKSYSGKILLPI